MSPLEICGATGEQLSLLGEGLVVTNDAILDDASMAFAGVRCTQFNGSVVDFEVFESEITRGDGDLEVYPLDGRNNPIPIEANRTSCISDQELKTLVSSVLVARAFGH